MTHSIPDSSAVALGTELGTVLVTGDYKFDQTPVDGAPADVSRLAELGPRGCAAAVRRLDERRPSGLLAVGVGGRPAPGGGVRALRGADRGDELRLEHPPRAAGRRCGRGARPQGRAGRSLDAQERRNRPRARAHRGARRDAGRAPRARGLPGRADRDHLDRLSGRAALGAAADGLSRPPPGRAAPGRHGRISAPRRSRATSAP